MTAAAAAAAAAVTEESGVDAGGGGDGGAVSARAVCGTGWVLDPMSRGITPGKNDAGRR